MSTDKTLEELAKDCANGLKCSVEPLHSVGREQLFEPWELILSALQSATADLSRQLAEREREVERITSERDYAVESLDRWMAGEMHLYKGMLDIERKTTDSLRTQLRAEQERVKQLESAIAQKEGK